MENAADPMMQWNDRIPHSSLHLPGFDDINGFFNFDTFDLSLSSDLSSDYHSSLLSSHSQLSFPEARNHTHDEDMVSVSSVFFPGSHQPASDTIFRSSDSVLFYMQCDTIMKASKHAFEGFLNAPLTDTRFRDTITDIPDTSSVLNIIFHSIYNLSCSQHSPSFDDVERAVDRMPLYGFSSTKFLLPDTPLFDTLLSYAPVNPIRVYALAGKFDAHELAVKTSSHLLAYRLSDLTDDLVMKMGAVYLRRLMALHITLIDTLKRIILQPPHPHPSTSECDFTDQKRLSRAWALAASYLAWDSRPDLSIHQTRNTFAALGDYLDCAQCKEVLKTRVQEVVVKWVNVKRTI